MTFGPAPDERLLWPGRPSGIRAFVRPMDVLFAVFAVLAGLFFLTGAAATRRPGDPPTPLFIFFFPVVFFGVLVLLPRLISITRESAGTEYALTDRRIVIRSQSRLVELDLANRPYLELDRSLITGRAIYFGQRQMYEGFGFFYGASPAPACRGLTDAETVFRTISGARTRAKER